MAKVNQIISQKQFVKLQKKTLLCVHRFLYRAQSLAPRSGKKVQRATSFASVNLSLCLGVSIMTLPVSCFAEKME
jgi:hypothetical protein